MGRLGRLLPAFGLGAAASGRTVALIGLGVDRDAPTVATRLLAALARRAVTVTVRDRDSAEVLRSLGVAAEVLPDLSSLVPSAGRAAGIQRLRAIGLNPVRRPVIGLALTAVDPALAKQVVGAVIGAVDALPDLDFCLVPMSRHPFVAAHNDEVLARRIMAARQRVHCLDEVSEPGVLLGVFQALAGAVCMRYHSLLFAERAGIPVVPVPYAEKTRHWIAERGLRPVAPSTVELLAELGRARLARTA
jgi:polysaccharide pyruvyl transferase WcaK-like protein